MEDLTDEQLATLTAALVTLKEELETLLEETREVSKPVSLDQPFGRLSRMDAIQQQKMAQATRRRNEVRLTQVNAALNAVARDDYGFCNACGEAIALDRLKARPESPVCLSCQTAIERQRAR